MAGSSRLATAIEVKAAAVRGEPCRFGVGDGLHLWVKGPSKAQWVLRYRTRDGKRRDMGLGAYPAVSLAEARAAAREARTLGADPLAAREAAEQAKRKATAVERERQQAEARTFQAVAQIVVELKRPGWRNPKHARQWLATLEQYAFPLIGDTPVDRIGRADVLRLLAPLYQRVPETASRVRQRVEAVLAHARVQGWREAENVASKSALAGAAELTRPEAKRKRHYPALAWQDVPAFLVASAAVPGIAALAMRFMVLTAARSGEVRGARWREVDLEAKVWTVPGDRMKAKKAHRVPLSPAALAVLEALKPLRNDSDDLLFPGRREGKALSDMAISEVVRGMNQRAAAAEANAPLRWRDEEGRAIVPHGFRSSFKGWSLAQGWPDPLSELALAHVDTNKVRAAYARHDMLDQRRPMMDAWAAHCEREPDNVVTLAVRNRRAGGE